MSLKYEVLHSNNKARIGKLHTKHGIIDTPAFMPVGTAATVKAMTTESVAATGAQILLCNTYHLMLRPSESTVEKLGGLHKFMNWNKPILTDSGGFQVMSLSKLRKIKEEGVVFQSHIDGRKYNLTPEYSVEIQHKLDSNITMVLDECTPYPYPLDKAKESMERSMRWAERSKKAFVNRDGYGIFGIMQGSLDKYLREESSKALINIGFDGYAIGGLAIGEGQENMLKVLDYATDFLPSSKPRYLMGVGRPSDIILSVLRGVDMFDCVMPSRAGRNAKAFTSVGEINMKNAKHKEDPSALDPACDCPTCLNYSKGYLHHLIKAQEILACMLLTYHNLHFYQKLTKDIRSHILSNTLEDYAKETLPRLQKNTE